MFEGSDKGHPGIPVFGEENHFQYDPDSFPQLQLFGPTGCSVNPLNYNIIEQAAAQNQPIKRYREIEPSFGQQKLQISLDNNINNYNTSRFRRDESGLAGQVLINPNSVSTGLRLSYEEEERNNSSVTSSGEGMRRPLPGTFCLGDRLKLEIDRQKEEFDHYMRLQESNLMKGIRELNHKQTARFLNGLQKGVAKILQEKELEIEDMNRKNKELTEKIKQLSKDAQCWHYRAKYNESVANALKSNLEQAIAQGPVQVREGFGDSDAASYANNCVNNGFESNLLKCKGCNGKEVTMLLMPCRHLCLCKNCEVCADNCPVCQVMKTASVQVFMS